MITIKNKSIIKKQILQKKKKKKKRKKKKGTNEDVFFAIQSFLHHQYSVPTYQDI